MSLNGENLSKRYGKRMLFRNLSISVDPGDILCIWGPNGSGKSTLLKVLAGLVRPTSGTVAYAEGGKPLPPHMAKHMFGMASPDVILYDELTPVENLAFLLRMRGLPFEREATVARLEAVGLAGYADAMVGTFSSGMKQRLRLASAVLHDPKVLLLDEPGSYLDGDGMARVERLVTAGGPDRAVIIATNDPREKDWCSRVVELG